MVYRDISARCYQPARRPFAAFQRPFRPCRSYYDGKALSLLILSPATRKLSSTLSTHSIRNAGGTARADAFKTVMRLVSPLVVGAVWLLV